MQVIIAEKPSVAREIAAIVGATNRKDGFIEGNGYAVTWAFGHLVGLAMPNSMASRVSAGKTCLSCHHRSSSCPGRFGRVKSIRPTRVS